MPLTRLPQRLTATVGVHSVVDFFSFVIVALLPTFATHLDLSRGEKAAILATGSIFSGFSQPVVAWLSDRFDTRSLGTLGMATAVVSVGLYGYATSFWMLLGLASVAAIGIGAFHPPAAAAIGQLSGRRRSLGVAIFFMAGMLGGMAGNILSPRYVEAMSVAAGDSAEPAVASGLRSLAWLIIPGLAGCCVLGWAIHRVGHREHNHRDLRSAIAPAEMALRWRAFALLYLGNIAKFTVNMALVYLFIQWIERWTLQEAGRAELDAALGLAASGRNGMMQASMQLGMGGAGILLGALLSWRWEKRALIGIPLAGAIFIALFPHADKLADAAPRAVLPVALGLGVLGGVGFGGMIPVTIAIAQRLLPHRTSLASGMMMGGAWGFAAAGPFLARWLEGAIGLDWSFGAVAGLLVIPAALACFVPRELFRRA
jgi:FSR family fosmidomycin resistance protein-like MFS transporter